MSRRRGMPGAVSLAISGGAALLGGAGLGRRRRRRGPTGGLARMRGAVGIALGAIPRLLGRGDRLGPRGGVGLDRAGDPLSLLVALGVGEPFGVAPHHLAPLLDRLEPGDVVGRIPLRVGERDERVVVLGDVVHDRTVRPLEHGVEPIVVGLSRATVGPADAQRGDHECLVVLDVGVDAEEQVLRAVGVAVDRRIERDFPRGWHRPAVDVVVDGAEVVIGEEDILEDQVVGVVEVLRPLANRLGRLLGDVEVGGGEHGPVIASELVAQRGHVPDLLVDARDVGMGAAGRALRLGLRRAG
jgi:hypothetical protein